jgi:hypothetical protein
MSLLSATFYTYSIVVPAAAAAITEFIFKISSAH